MTTQDLFGFLKVPSDGAGRHGLLIMRNNREHEVALTEAKGSFVTGWIAHHLRVCLYKKIRGSRNLEIMIGRSAQIKKECYDDQSVQVFFDQECFIRTSHQFFANISEISAMDVIECPYFRSDPRIGDAVNLQQVVAEMPDIREFYVLGQGFIDPHVTKPVTEEVDSDEVN